MYSAAEALPEPSTFACFHMSSLSPLELCFSSTASWVALEWALPHACGRAFMMVEYSQSLSVWLNVRIQAQTSSVRPITRRSDGDIVNGRSLHLHSMHDSITHKMSEISSSETFLSMKKQQTITLNTVSHTIKHTHTCPLLDRCVCLKWQFFWAWRSKQ